MQFKNNRIEGYGERLSGMPHSRIIIELFRHDDKEASKDGVPDEEVRLTEKGRINASKKADLRNIDQAVAFGSPRKRAQETAGLHMAGALDGISGNESLEELREKLGEDLTQSKNKKISIDDRLDFTIANTEYGAEATEAFKKGRLLDYLVHESDRRAAELGDKETATYSRQAASIAEIIKKYIIIAPRFDKLVSDPNKHYKHEMQRFLGTHQTKAECFLAKCIEKTRGNIERDRFVKTLKGKGFDFSEGIRIEIDTKEAGEKPLIHVMYKKVGDTPETTFEYDAYVDEPLLDEILADNK